MKEQGATQGTSQLQEETKEARTETHSAQGTATSLPVAGGDQIKLTIDIIRRPPAEELSIRGSWCTRYWSPSNAEAAAPDDMASDVTPSSFMVCTPAF